MDARVLYEVARVLECKVYLVVSKDLPSRC